MFFFLFKNATKEEKRQKRLKQDKKTQHKKTEDCATQTQTKTESDLIKVIRYCSTSKVLIPGKVYLSHIWHNVSGILGPKRSSTFYLFCFITVLI